MYVFILLSLFIYLHIYLFLLRLFFVVVVVEVLYPKKPLEICIAKKEVYHKNIKHWKTSYEWHNDMQMKEKIRSKDMREMIIIDSEKDKKKHKHKTQETYANAVIYISADSKALWIREYKSNEELEWTAFQLCETVLLAERVTEK